MSIIIARVGDVARTSENSLIYMIGGIIVASIIACIAGFVHYHRKAYGTKNDLSAGQDLGTPSNVSDIDKIVNKTPHHKIKNHENKFL